MKEKSTNNIRALRKVFGQTQTEFAATIGASKDAVVSWENGRNPLSAGFARRISLATGADAKSLLGTGPLWVSLSQPKRPFTLAEYGQHRKTYWEGSAQNSAGRHVGRCADALELILRAAAQAGEERGTLALPGVLDSFVQWCRQAEEDFQLLNYIEAQLAQRKGVLELTKSWGQWRELAKHDPKMAKAIGFVDDPKRDDNESLTLSLESIPVWAPGWEMRRGKK